MPGDWKPMSTIGAGVIEVRVHTEVEHRIVVIAKFDDAIYVLHVFEKRSRKTLQRDLNVARRRYHDVLRGRRTR